jgi:succinoglycan biosynthesis protein ExoV
MKLSFFHSNPTNFGDRLNEYIWDRLVPPGFLDDDEAELFIGIGSIIVDDLFPAGAIKYVIGSGYGGYTPIPEKDKGKWRFVFVRGPRTAAALNLPADRAICDPAMMLRSLENLPAPADDIGVAFMPHFESLDRGDWQAACRLAGVTLIDPTATPEQVISEIRGARLLITEAMHGAIVADALRVPWIAVRPFHRSHRAKWLDWADGLHLRLRFFVLPPSSLAEMVTFITGRGAPARLNIMAGWSRVRWLSPLRSGLAAASGLALRRLKTRSGQLSDDRRLDELVGRAGEALTAFVREKADTSAGRRRHGNNAIRKGSDIEL